MAEPAPAQHGGPAMVNQMKDLLAALHSLRQHTEDTENRLDEEMAAHAKAKEHLKRLDLRLSEESEGLAQARKRIAALEADGIKAKSDLALEQESHAATRAASEEALSAHQVSKVKLSEEERAHAKTQELLDMSKNDLSRARLATERLETEKETLRVIIYDKVMEYVTRERKLLRGQYDALQGEHMQTKSALDSLAEKHEALEKEHQTAREESATAVIEATKQKQVHDEAIAEHTATQACLEKQLEELNSTSARLSKSVDSYRDRTMRALQNQFNLSDTNLAKNCLGEWSKLIKDDKKAKERKRQNLSRCLRSIARGDEMLLAEVVRAWGGSKSSKQDDAALKELDEARRIMEEQRQLAAMMATEGKQKTRAALEKQFMQQDTVLTKKVFEAWVKHLREEASRSKNMTRCLRGIAGGDGMLKQMVFAAWAGMQSDKEMIAERQEMEKYKQQKEAEQKAAAERAERNKEKAREVLNKQFMQQDGYLKRKVWESWTGFAAAGKAARELRDKNMQRCMKNIMASANALAGQCFNAWEKLFMREALRKKLTDQHSALKEKDEHVNNLTKQLRDSAWVTREIQNELNKAHGLLPKTPRKAWQPLDSSTKTVRPKSGSGSRPQSRTGSRPSSRQGALPGSELPAISPRY